MMNEAGMWRMYRGLARVGAVLCAGALYTGTASAQYFQNPQGSTLAARASQTTTERAQRELETKRLLAGAQDKRSTLAGFSAVLLVGELQASGAATLDNIPAAARKALSDMQDFLPYKGYYLLDVAWLAGSQGGGGGSLRLRGPEGQAYQLDLGGPDKDLGVSVRLVEAEGSPSMGRLILDTTFLMSVGESVVVGTSRLSGNRALVLLLTAASQGR